MIGTKIYKPLDTQGDYDAYSKCAEWCNANNATIEDKGDYYEVVAIPTPSLEETKQNKIAELKSERDTKEVEPIEYNGNSFDYDDKARERINAAIIALENTSSPAVLTWTTADNQDVIVTANDLKGIISAVALRSNALHVAYRKAKEKVENAITKEDVEAVTLEVE